MNVVKNEVMKELSKRCNKSEKIIKIMIEECNKIGLNLKESERYILDFLNK